MTNKKEKLTIILTFLTIISTIVIIIGNVKNWWKSEAKTIEGDNNRVESDNNTIIYNYPQTKINSKVDNKSPSKYLTPEYISEDTINKANNVKNTIAILPFENSSQNEEFKWLSKGIAESLIEAFSSNPKYTLIEGNQRDKILGEINFQQGGSVDLKTAVKAGKLLGANQVVIGSYQIYNSRIFISSRIVEVELGVIKKKSTITFNDTLTNIIEIQNKFCKLLKSNSILNE
jgi:TolB-like protein